MSLRPIDEQIALELTEPDPVPDTILTIWIDEKGKVRSAKVQRVAENRLNHSRAA